MMRRNGWRGEACQRDSWVLLLAQEDKWEEVLLRKWVAGGTVSPTKQVGILRHGVKTAWELNITPVWLCNGLQGWWILTRALSSEFVSTEKKIEQALDMGQGLGLYFGIGFWIICLHHVERKDVWSARATKPATTAAAYRNMIRIKLKKVKPKASKPQLCWVQVFLEVTVCSGVGFLISLHSAAKYILQEVAFCRQEGLLLHSLCLS